MGMHYYEFTEGYGNDVTKAIQYISIFNAAIHRLQSTNYVWQSSQRYIGALLHLALQHCSTLQSGFLYRPHENKGLSTACDPDTCHTDPAPVHICRSRISLAYSHPLFV